MSTSSCDQGKSVKSCHVIKGRVKSYNNRRCVGPQDKGCGQGGA